MKRRTPASRRRAGQAAVEYLLCLVALCVGLLLPFAGGESAAVRIAFAIRGFLRGTSFLISIS